MTKQEQYYEFASDFFQQCLSISKAKNADYTGGADDPFANFTGVEVLHIPTEVGFITRMHDKMARIASFVKNGQLQVKDESVIDTLQDLANYACLFAGYLRFKQVSGTKSKPKEEQDVVTHTGICTCIYTYAWGSISTPTKTFKEGAEYEFSFMKTSTDSKYARIRIEGNNYDFDIPTFAKVFKARSKTEDTSLNTTQ